MSYRSALDIATWEKTTLAPYALHSSESLGREFNEAGHPFQTPFQVDVHRIIHSTAFRRLEYKTQVFVNHEGDHYRTRLTHSIEVAQISKMVARALNLNTDLVEGLVLAHDFGHTPFGHAGEHIVNTLMAEEGGFRHNEQSLRTVERLEKLTTEFPGLNLTFEMREGIVKHETSYDHAQIPIQYRPEWAPFLEAQIINFTDVIAFNGHDLEDGFESGLLEFEELSALRLWQEAKALLPINRQTLPRKLAAKNIIDEIVKHQVSDLLQVTGDAITASGFAHLNDVRKSLKPVAGFSSSMQKKNQELMKFLMEQLYKHPRVIRMEEKARMIISRLFGSYVENPKQLPKKIFARIDQENSVKRVVCDYIAGMTDRYAIDEYAKLFDPYVKV